MTLDPAPLAEPARVEREVLLTVQEYAELHRVHTQTVYLAIKRGQLPFRVIRATTRSIRIAVPRENVETLTTAE